MFKIVSVCGKPCNAAGKVGEEIILDWKKPITFDIEFYQPINNINVQLFFGERYICKGFYDGVDMKFIDACKAKGGKPIKQFAFSDMANPHFPEFNGTATINITCEEDSGMSCYEAVYLEKFNCRKDAEGGNELRCQK